MQFKIFKICSRSSSAQKALEPVIVAVEGRGELIAAVGVFLLHYTNTNTQIQVCKYKDTNTQTKNKVQKYKYNTIQHSGGGELIAAVGVFLLHYTVSEFETTLHVLSHNVNSNGTPRNCIQSHTSLPFSISQCQTPQNVLLYSFKLLTHPPNMRTTMFWSAIVGLSSTSRPCPNKRAECWSCQRANPPPRLRCQSPASRHLGPRAGWELLHGHHHHEGHHPPHYGHFFSHTKTPGWEFLQIHHHHCTALCCTRLA